MLTKGTTMTDDLDTARAHMQDIITWWDVLGDVAETATGVVGHRLSMTGVHGPSRDATETAILQIDAIDTIVREVEGLAVKLGWRSGKDGDPKLYIHTHLDWAQTNLAPAEWVGVISDLHRRIGAITGHAPRPTTRQCPLCGETLRIIPPPRPTWQTVEERRKAATQPDKFICDGCEEERDAEEIATLVRWRLASNPDTYVNIREASRILDVPEQTIYSWVRRGQLERTTDGMVSLSDTRSLTTTGVREDHA